MLAHDALFEQYPQLLDVGVRFGDTDDAGGYWDQERNEIVISNRYRHADPAFLELTLLHEIQHAIQDIEGFAGGSNPEYWEQRQRSNDPIREHDAAIAKAEREAQAALKGVPPEVQKDFWYAANMNHTDPEGAEKLENELFEGEYADAYSDYSWAIWTLQDLLEQDNPKRAAKDLYRNTAGEIEARDAANRRHLDAETRKNRLPDTGDERTVFVEGGTRAFSLKGKRADGIEVYETSAETRSLSWQKRKNQFLRLMRDQYRGRTAKFIRNGHAYYATFEYRDVSKNIYGDSESDPKGKDAKINVGADGGIFELVENAEYFLSEAERGKTQRMHRGVKYWDYFIKTVQIDGEVYDLLAHIRKKDSGSFVYDIEMYQNKKIEPSSPGDSLESGRNRVPNSSMDIISDSGRDVKQYSMKETDREYTMQDIGALQQERYQLKEERNRLLMGNPHYAKAVEDRRYATTFKERAEASRAIRAAEAEVDTSEIDARMAQIDDLITDIRESEKRRHERDRVHVHLLRHQDCRICYPARYPDQGAGL